MINNQTNYFSDINKTKWKELKNKKIAIIHTQWNSQIVNNLLSQTSKLLEFLDIKYQTFEVAGAYEIPYMCKKLFTSKNDLDAVITLGCLVKGETIHFEMISLAVSVNISAVSIEIGKPIGFGVLTVNNIKQAEDRSQLDNNNKGLEATAAILDLLLLESTIN